jgi:hypothetical protein
MQFLHIGFDWILRRGAVARTRVGVIAGRWIFHLAICVLGICVLGARDAEAQSAQYRTVEVNSLRPVQLAYHALAKKDCSPAPLLQVQVTQPPKQGALTVKAAKLKTNRIADCPQLEVPVQLILYEAPRNFQGSDKVAYQVTNEKGETNTFVIVLTINTFSKADPVKPDPEKGKI